MEKCPITNKQNRPTIAGFWKKMTALNKVMTVATALAVVQAISCFIYGLHHFALGDLGEGSVLWLFGVALTACAVKAGEQIERNANLDNEQ